MRPFVHLSLHTEFSIRDSIVRIPQLIAAVKAAQMPAIAMTDDTNLFALVKFYRAAVKAGIKPIVGADVRVVDSRLRRPFHVTLLCRNRDGYRRLSELLSRAFVEREVRSAPMIQRDWLRERNDDLIAIAGNLRSDLAAELQRGRDDAAQQLLADWQRDFGQRYVIGVGQTGREGEQAWFNAALSLASQASVPAVAVNDVRFLTAADFEVHEARVCIQQGRTLDDPRREKRYTAEQYLKTGDEMVATLAPFEALIDNSLAIAQQCNLELTLGEYSLPAFPTPRGEPIDVHLHETSKQGLDQRLQAGLADGYTRNDYDERLQIELKVITDMGFPGYFMIVADFIAWAKNNDVPVGPGRGSGAGSVVAWALGITDVDPLEHELLFERFLNPERVSMPDFDVDFCMDRRDEVIDYVAERYGRDQVAQIITYGSMAARAVLRDGGRVLGYPYGMTDQLAKLVPMKPGMTLEKAIDAEPELGQRIENEPEVKALFDLALALEGLTRNAGKHAGGVVIAPSALTDFTPLYCEAGSTGIVSQFDKDDVESIGLVKFDFLGLRTLTIVDWALKSINEMRAVKQQEPIELDTLPLDDPATFKLLCSAQTTAVFQLESHGMKELIAKLKPDSFNDIVALVALYRPGPLDAGMVDTYVNCKHGREAVRYPHDSLVEILEPTYGVILYQEQVMQIAQVLSGYTLGGADILRRAMGKKKAEEMARQRTVFVDGAQAGGVDPKLASDIFDLIEKFAGYGFNKSHSVAYALIAYQTAYLKTHYPAPFMAAVLSADMENTDKIVGLQADCHRLGLAVLPPDVNRSHYRFRARDERSIRYGLGAIKGVGRGVIEAIVEARGDEPFDDLGDLLARVGSKMNRRVMEAMLKSGALDSLAPRGCIAAGLEDALRAADQFARDKQAGQSDLFGTSTPQLSFSLPDVEDWSQDDKLAGERETLGLYLSGHPIDRYRSEIQRFVSGDIARLSERMSGLQESGGRGEAVVTAGLITDVRRNPRRNSAFIKIDDGTGQLEVAFFGEVLEGIEAMIKPDTLLVIDGELRNDDYTGGVNLRAKRAYDLDVARCEHARGLHLSLSQGAPAADLQSMLAPHRADRIPVFIDIPGQTGETTRMELGQDWRVRLSPALFEKLRDSTAIDQLVVLY